ncbi:MAG: hypothetical protein LR011_06955 [Verrucomicrobia bacterium]|nr:hypothetical protein [Verrucomicrobiota bacterium]
MNLRKSSQARSSIPNSGKSPFGSKGELLRLASPLQSTWIEWTGAGFLHPAGTEGVGLFSRLLFQWELPAIRKTMDCLRSGDGSVLELDQSMTRFDWPEPALELNKSIARKQLAIFYPLYDCRWWGRYSQVIDEGGAHGWQSIVYGMFYHTYSIPVTQAMSHYASQYLMIAPHLSQVIPDWQEQLKQALAASLHPNNPGGSFQPKVL